MRLVERIVHALTRRQVLVHLVPVSQVERNGAVHLLESQRGKRRTDRLGGLAVLELSHDARKGDTCIEFSGIIAA